MARSDQDLLALLADLESDQVERKSQLKNKKPEIFQAVCAFSTIFRAMAPPASPSSARTTTGRRPV